MDRLTKHVAEAIDSVQLFSRIDDWTSDARKGYPVEVCRYGKAGEPEIVVLKRLPTGTDEREALREAVSEARALAAIDAINKWR
jgi:hypothetical protein